MGYAFWIRILCRDLGEILVRERAVVWISDGVKVAVRSIGVNACVPSSSFVSCVNFAIYMGVLYRVGWIFWIIKKKILAPK